jgi:hypothetical protein
LSLKIGRGWLLFLVAVVVVLSVRLWWPDRNAPSGVESVTESVTSGPAEGAGASVVVSPTPGWDLLSEDDRRRADTPLSDGARAWLETERAAILRIAGLFDISPVALGGIVAAEKTLLVGRVDAIGEELFGAIFGSLREQDLERWVSDQEAAFRRGEMDGRRGGVVRNPYLWTLGPAQVSFRLAVQYEPMIARQLDRPRRGAKDVLGAVTSTPGNLEYAAALLAEAQRAYGDVGMDISTSPGVLATLYHLGAPTVRARRLAGENAARRTRDEPVIEPHVNYYGAFVSRHSAEIEELLGAED